MEYNKFLVLEDGTVFPGFAFGSKREAVGELVFTTNNLGYIETLTDPSYFGQIVMQTMPQIGNYGIIPDDFECEKPALFGYVVKDKSDVFSNFRAKMSLDEFLISNNIPGIFGVDTRELTIIVRQKGVMNAVLCNKVPDDLSFISKYSVKDAVKSVTCKTQYEKKAIGESKKHVVLFDFGAKNNIIRCLAKRGCDVTVVSADTRADDVLGMSPDGIMLSNGPGDPKENTLVICEIKKLMGKVPMFGICLGHQLLALANGGDTVKLKYGHRGSNQPCRIFGTHKTFMTSQNHGYAVCPDSVEGGTLIFENANDLTVEGLAYFGKKAFSVQFHPEAASGPKDTEWLFDEFLKLMN